MTSPRLDRARGFIQHNARLLERRLWDFEFDGGGADAVVQAVAAYENPDGGFAGVLEPDIRDLGSQPQGVLVALEALEAVDRVSGPMVARACDWLDRVSPHAGAPNALPAVNASPHAPWWAVSDDKPPPSVNPTAAILAVLLRRRVRHAWVNRAGAFCWAAIEASETREFHDLTPMIAFLEATPDRFRADPALTRLGERILSEGLVALDIDAEGYVHKPLEWAPTPQSYGRRLFDDATIARHLDALAAAQQDDGGWPIFWPPLSPGVEMEWRGVMTLKAVRTLQAYGV